jgi:hypothetical protein
MPRRHAANAARPLRLFAQGLVSCSRGAAVVNSPRREPWGPLKHDPRSSGGATESARCIALSPLPGLWDNQTSCPVAYATGYLLPSLRDLSGLPGTFPAPVTGHPSPGLGLSPVKRAREIAKAAAAQGVATSGSSSLASV